jgi:Flp pilus assembly protein TadG
MFPAPVTLRTVVARFRHRCEGSIVPLVAIALVPMVGLVGVAVDYSRANSIRSQMQTALDSAMLAGAKDDSSNWATTALNVFNATFNPQGSTATAPKFALNADGSFSGSVSSSVPMDFVRVIGSSSSMSVNARSTATVAPTSPGAQYCLVALNLTAQPSVQVSGNGSISITAPSCVMQVNSNASNSVDLSGNATVATTDNCIHGGVKTNGNSTIAPPPDAVCKTLPDPFVNYPKPTIGSCYRTNYTYSSSDPPVPGQVYCGGMSFSGNVSVTFPAGTYYIKDGAVTESGGTFTGNGVTFYLTGQNAGFQMSGKANWHLVAPTTGPFAGFVIFLDPNGPSGTPASSSQLSGKSELYFEGVVYLPQQSVTITGTAEVFAPSPWTSFVADTLQITGNGSLVINNNTSLTSVPIPIGLQMRTGGRLWLTQ